MVQISWLILVAGTGVLLARRNPVLAANMSSGIAIAVLACWLTVSALGFWVQMQQGDINSIGTEATARRLHTIAAHGVVIIAWLAFLWAVPVSIVRGIREGGLWKTIFQASMAFAVIALVLLSAFTGYLNADDPGSHLRFRVLHTIAAPVLGTAAVIVFYAVMERARRAVRDSQSKLGP